MRGDGGTLPADPQRGAARGVAARDLLRREIVDRMVATLPQGSSVEAPGLGHGMMLEDQNVFYDSVKEFLELP